MMLMAGGSGHDTWRSKWFLRYALCEVMMRFFVRLVRARLYGPAYREGLGLRWPVCLLARRFAKRQDRNIVEVHGLRPSQGLPRSSSLVAVMCGLLVTSFSSK